MSNLHPDSRRTSSEQPYDELAESPELQLSRTKSQDFNGVENIVVQDVDPSEIDDDETAASRPHLIRYLIWICAFLTSMSFGVTQVPILYVFRLMTCDAYYDDHQSQNPPVFGSTAAEMVKSMLVYVIQSTAVPSGMNIAQSHDRCSINEIETSTALSVSLLGASTTVFGIMNLFLTGSLIKRIGVKPTLLIQIFFPAVRLLVQNIGVEVWGKTGIIIVQCSQIVTIIGGPSGYLLVLNTFMTDVVEHEGRTAALGRLSGAAMAGSAAGFLIGGIVAEAYGIKAPFRLTLIMFLLSCAYVFIFLPHLPPVAPKTLDSNAASHNKKRSPFAKFFAPLAVFAPRKFICTDGSIQRELGTFLLAWGVFLGILATGYLPTLLQLFSTDVFDFGTKENGWLIFMYSMLRGAFLTFAFPKLIAIGRKWVMHREEVAANQSQAVENPAADERQPLLSTENNRTKSATVDEPVETADKKEQTFTFDLTYTRFSLIADGLLTLLCSFVREGWQMYLVAAILPFAAGTGAAAKGTILQMVGTHATSSERTDALAGISLVENMARLSTTFVFGVVFAGFASIGRTELVFTCNAAVALVGFGVMLFARFPPEGSRPLDKVDTTPSDSQ